MMIKMVEYQFFYRLDTLQIDAVYRGCKTNSTKFKDANVYAEVNVVDPAYEVSRNYKVIVDDGGNVIGTEGHVNPFQPKPAITELPSEVALKSTNKKWKLTITDTGKINVKEIP